MNNIGNIANIFSLVCLIFLVWNSIRARYLKAKYDGKPFKVPSDEVKEAFRRAALAEASRQAGGRRVQLSLEWKKNTLIIETEKKV